MANAKRDHGPSASAKGNHVQQLAADLLPGVRLVVVAAFAGLALLAVVDKRRTGTAGRWAAAAFAAMAIALFARLASGWLVPELPPWADDVRLAVLLASPYLLLRFTASFQPLPRWLEAVAALAVLVVLAATLATPSLPEPTAARPAWAGAYLVGAAAYWLAVSLVTVQRLWRAGRGQPGAARRRMRLMSLATAALTLALLLAAALRGAGDDVRLLIQLIGLVSVAAFALGLHPPQALRLSWRREDEQQLQHGMMAILRATTTQEVAQALLPPTTRVVGGSGAALVDHEGTVVASHGQAPATGSPLTAAEPASNRASPTTVEVVPLDSDLGELVVYASPYTPFFGQDEVDLLRTMGAVASLALQRIRLLDEERRQRSVLDEARLDAEHARDEAARANTAKSEFLSRMSHELRTPLNAIMGFGQLLDTPDVDEHDRRDFVGHILKAGKHLLALIDDVLDLSRIEAGEMTVSPEAVHSGELIEGAIGLIRPAADARSIRLVTDLTQCDAYVTTDRQRCRQVLLNLLSNAVKYNHDGGRVQVACAQPADGFFRVTVADTGPGIDRARHDRLFQPFERLGADASGVEGTGLGLALSKQLVERMGGMLGFDSAAGQGSTFWIDLPLTEAPTAPPPTTATTALEHPVTAPVPAGGRTLLLIEDNLANLRVVEALLRRRPDITVLPAMHGALGIDLAREHQPDLIVLDLHLPDLPGRQALHRLKADPATRDIPVIVASADASEGRIQQLQAEGAFDYVTKPLDLHRFLDAIDAGIESAAEHRRTTTRNEEPQDPDTS